MPSTSGYDALSQAANVDASEALLDSFRPAYLQSVFERELGLKENVNATPEACAQKVLGKLKAAAAALEKSNRLHETMDRRHFEELVKSENVYITRGVDKKKGRKVIFFRTGHIFRGSFNSGSNIVVCVPSAFRTSNNWIRPRPFSSSLLVLWERLGIWRYQTKSPRADAFAAANNFWIKSVIANIPLDAKGEKLQVVIICDLSEAGYLDFSPTMQIKATEFAVEMLYPLPAVILIFGAPTICGLFVKCLQACLPSSVQDVIQIVEYRDEIEELIGPDDTPSWWYDDDSPQQGVPFSPQNPRVRWQFEESLERGYAVTLAEIWNPGPWLENAQDAGLSESRERAKSALDTIEEDPEDEW